MEGKQFVGINRTQKKGNARRKMGLTYNSCNVEEDDSENRSKGASKSPTYASMLAKKCGKYFR